MSLREELEKVAGMFRTGTLDSKTIEAQIKKSVIEPVLRALGWDDADPRECELEYSVGSGLVDYALKDHKKPLVFIEAKRPGNLSAKAEDQLFNYATNEGVPLLVLTDGNIWDFYLSMAAGKPSERMFCRIELEAQDNERLSQNETRFSMFLDKKQVVSEEARRSAEKYHADNKNQRLAREQIPNAWKSLLEPPDDLLIELISNEIYDLCQAKPRNKDVVDFLKKLSLPTDSSTRRRAPKSSQPSQEQEQKQEQTVSHPSPELGLPSKRIVGYKFGSHEVRTQSAIATLLGILEELHQRDSSFFERLYHDPRNRPKTRAFISLDRSELYPEEFFERNKAAKSIIKELDDGWLLGANLSVEQIYKKVELVCDVAGVSLGSELVLLYEE